MRFALLAVHGSNLETNTDIDGVRLRPGKLEVSHPVHYHPDIALHDEQTTWTEVSMERRDMTEAWRDRAKINFVLVRKNIREIVQ